MYGASLSCRDAHLGDDEAAAKMRIRLVGWDGRFLPILVFSGSMHWRIKVF
jgi:hypothetical protein